MSGPSLLEVQFPTAVFQEGGSDSASDASKRFDDRRSQSDKEDILNRNIATGRHCP